jgi:hypothetical protein
MASIPAWVIGRGIDAVIGAVKDSSKKEEKKPEEKKPADEEKPKQEPKKEYKKGGYVRAADGCAKRGKTKGRMV